MLNKFYKDKISKYIIPLEDIPLVYEKDFFKDALDSMIKNNLGVICIIDKNLVLKGIFTDGDIRRNLINVQKPLSAFFSDYVKEHMNKKPFTINKNNTVLHAIKLMNKKKIWDIPVVSNSNKLIGILHLNSLLKYLYKK